VAVTPEQNIHGHAFNALTAELTGYDWMRLSKRSRLADVVVAAVDPVIRAYERTRFLEASKDFPEPFRFRSIIAEAA
jgi:hypothetical protein